VILQQCVAAVACCSIHNRNKVHIVTSSMGGSHMGSSLCDWLEVAKLTLVHRCCTRCVPHPHSHHDVHPCLLLLLLPRSSTIVTADQQVTVW